MGLINISVLFNVDLCAILKKISCLEIHLGLKIVNTVWSRLLLIGSCFVDKISFFQILQMRTSNKLIQIQHHTFSKKPFISPWTLTSYAFPGFLFCLLLLTCLTGFVMPNRYDILNYVFEKDSSPAQGNFKDLCSEWIYLNFPLAKGEDVTKFLKNFCVQSCTKWKEVKSDKSKLYEQAKYKSYFSILVHFSQDQPDAQPAAMEVEGDAEIDLSSPKRFLEFVCPASGCAFKDRNEAKFRKHVIAKHPFVPGKCSYFP